MVDIICGQSSPVLLCLVCCSDAFFQAACIARCVVPSFLYPTQIRIAKINETFNGPWISESFRVVAQSGTIRGIGPVPWLLAAIPTTTNVQALGTFPTWVRHNILRHHIIAAEQCSITKTLSAVAAFCLFPFRFPVLVDMTGLVLSDELLRAMDLA